MTVIPSPAAPVQPTVAMRPQAPVRAGIRNRTGIWFFAVVFIVVAPLLPVFIEAVKFGEVKPETYLLTTAVLSVGYGFSSQEPLFWGAYGLLFFGSLGYDFNPGAAPPPLPWPAFLVETGGWIMQHLALSSMLMVAALQTIERFMWHVVWDRQFPDWRQGG